LTKLLLWHGRNSYRRSAKLAQFVIHRGLIISVMQAVFSSIFYFAPIALYQGWLMVGYATIYTMAPVFSLVLDRDLNEDLALSYPELYKELTKVRTPSASTSPTTLLLLGTCAHLAYLRVIVNSRAERYLQDILHLAHDQRLPRCFHLFLQRRRQPDVSFLSRRRNHDYSPRSVRERVFEHRRHFIHRISFERTYHGRTGNHDLVRPFLPSISPYGPC
jgi:hypothetical protein